MATSRAILLTVAAALTLAVTGCSVSGGTGGSTSQSASSSLSLTTTTTTPSSASVASMSESELEHHIGERLRTAYSADLVAKMQTLDCKGGLELTPGASQECALEAGDQWQEVAVRAVIGADGQIGPEVEVKGTIPKPSWADDETPAVTSVSAVKVAERVTELLQQQTGAVAERSVCAGGIELTEGATQQCAVLSPDSGSWYGVTVTVSGVEADGQTGDIGIKVTEQPIAKPSYVS